MNLKQYTLALQVLENEIRQVDPVTAYNIARELSVIYVKLNYDKVNPTIVKAQKSRLLSMVDYIMKTIPMNAEALSTIILDYVES